MNRLLLLTALLLFAFPALAADNWQDCSADHEAGREITSPLLQPAPMGPSSLCYDTDGTANSSVVNVASCDHVDVLLFNLTDGSTDVGAQYMNCGTTAGTNCWVTENVTLDGDPATDTEAIYGVGSQYGYINVTVNTTTDDLRVLVRCNRY